MLLGYLMEKTNMDLKTSLDLVRSKRPIAQPNPGFILQLIAFEKEIFGKNSLLQEEIDKLCVRSVEVNNDDDDQDSSDVKELSDSMETMKLSGGEV